MVVSALMRGHGSDPAPPAEAGKVVLSIIGRGESLISAPALSIKMVLEGEEFYVVDGRTYRLRPGQLLVVDAGAPLTAYSRTTDESRGLCLYLPTIGGERLHFDTDELPRVAVLTADLHPYARTLQRLGGDLHRNPLGLRNAASSIVSTGGQLIDSARVGSGRDMDGLPFVKANTKRNVLNRLETARAFLHANAHRPVTLGEIAIEAQLAPFYLNRCFAWSFGATPVRYHRSLRLRLAEAMLAKGQSPSQVAEEIGYGELSSFTHAFKREFGRPPSRPGMAPRIS